MEEQDLEVLRLLIGRGADVNHVSRGEAWFEARGTPLAVATSSHARDVVQLLLDADADPDVECESETLTI